ncbi:MAG: SDR family oxidoreductase, partial [Polyangiaceae bacterium]|nr:SDR family oxidoreductase [Polyangiaceae bacterium]
VNTIAPGLVATKLSKALVDAEDASGPILARTATARVAVPEEIAGGAVYLASGESSYVTGHTLVIDGGWTIA